MLTRKQHELLMFIHERIKETGVSPSFDEMKEALDLASKSGIHRLITALEERGFIRRLAHRARALEVVKLPQQATTAAPPKGRGAFRPQVFEGGGAPPPSAPAPAANDSRELPILGRIAAGTPIDAIQHERERLPVPEAMLGNGEHYVLEVQGDSMIEAGILDGDYVIIKKGDTATSGEIVVALVGEEATLKRLRKKGRLDRPGGRQPEVRNPDLRPRPGRGAGQAGGPDPPVSLGAESWNEEGSGWTDQILFFWGRRMLTVLLMMAQMEALSLDSASLHTLSGRPIKVYYPDQAMRAGVDGVVQARCAVGPDARLEACELLSVAPAGQGFDDSAKRLLADIAAAPAGKDGQPTAGKSIQFTI